MAKEPNLTTVPFTPDMDAADTERRNELEALVGAEDAERILSGQTNDEGVPDRPTGDIGRNEPDPEPDVPAVPMSPADQKRAEIAARFKRTDGAPFDGDMTKDENLYGSVARVAEEPDPDLPAPGENANTPTGTTPPGEPGEETFTIKVRGKDVTLTRSQLLEKASKVEAGDSYLEETREMLKQAKIAAKTGAPADSQRPEDGDGNVPDPDDTSSRRPGNDTKSVVELLQYGDPEEAARALDALVDQRADERATNAQVERLKKNDLAASQRALQTFIKDNPKLAASKEASQLIENGVYEVYREELQGLGLKAEVIPRDPADLAEWARHYRIMGHPVSNAVDVLNKSKERVLKVLNPALLQDDPPTPRKAPANVEVNVDRTARRAAIPNQPTRATAPRPAASQQTAPARKSPSDVINEMRKARGQPVA